MNMAGRWVVSIAVVCGVLTFIRPFMANQVLGRAAAYYSVAAYSDAIRLYRKAIVIDGSNLRAWVSLGYAYKQKGDMERAADTFKKALDANLHEGSGSNGIGFLDYRRSCLKGLEECKN
ncbi:MAG: tetratricopeptide repeat protein [Candidatus Omnitrophota bacterium]